MAGIYIHIPFCRQACTYCNFHYSTRQKDQDRLLNAIGREIELTPRFEDTESICSIYFGGGTPSIIRPEKLNEILWLIRKKFPVDKEAEITFEANPDDISRETLAAWEALGINRLSIGIQSFDDSELRWMNRAHVAKQSVSALELVTVSGIKNFSIDLIYGSNLQSDEQLLQNLEIVAGFSVPHISCYGLTVEPKTKLHHLVTSGKDQLPDEQKQARQFLLVMNWMQEHGYEHYELSNYALPGMRSRHNSSYWDGLPYYGFGPSAHSYNGHHIRSWNIANNAIYTQQLELGILPAEREELTETQLLNEYIMTRLRTMEGLNLDYLENSWGIHNKSRIEKACLGYLKRGLLVIKNQNLVLTQEGMLMADAVAADLFTV